MAALAAGDAEGGDRHGESSATVYVVDRGQYPLWDIASTIIVTLAELRRLHEVFARGGAGNPRHADPRQSGRGGRRDHLSRVRRLSRVASAST